MINDNKRLKLHMKESYLEIIFNLTAIASIVATVIYSKVMWSKIPSIVPTHFNSLGQVNGYGSKDTLLILPIISIVFFVAINLLAKFPHVFNYTIKITEENAKRQYRNARLLLRVLLAEISILFLYIQWSSIKGAMTSSAGLGVLFTPLYMIIVIATLVYFITRMNKLK